ncbi:MAG TPA: glycosyltransferase family 4 protein [Dehalococcoidia bacterium]|jgi:phosphatidylinositol alpha-1,6-mannosyltransferase|nr:glycosyltransferase family 4 protein [Dehalococcoidia bacterium]
MHILMFSYDKTLVEGRQIGDTLLRHQHYAEHLDRLDILVPAPAAKRQAEIKVSEKLTIYPSYGHKVLSWLRSYLKARRICRKSRVDIIVTQDALLGFLGVLLRKEFGCKLQINAFGLEIFSDWWLRQSWLHRCYRLIMGWTLRKANLVRTDATQSKVLLTERLNIPPEKVVVIPALPSAESIAKFVHADGDRIRKSLLGSEYDRMVLFVGALEKVKNIPNLLRAAKLVLSTHPKTLFVIIGSGSEKAHLEEMCGEMAIAGNVRFLGIIPYDDLPAYYAACDLVVLPSWSEGFARTLMEAAFAQKPIVATDVGGARDIVTDGESGYIVAVDDSAQLAGRIIKLLSHPEKAKLMGQEGYQKAMAYCDFAANTKRLVEVWKSLLESNEAKE